MMMMIIIIMKIMIIASVFMCYVVVVCVCDLSMCFISFIVPKEGNFRDEELVNKPNVTTSLK
jgi:hypothetical protein